MSGPNPSGQVSGARPPYSKPADGHRPYGAHRFDVYSIKAGRRLTLFGRGPLNLWIQLEADPTVTHLCERPLVVPDCEPRRVVDFWAGSDNLDRLIFLIRGDDPMTAAKRQIQLAAFRIWAADAGCKIEERVTPEPSGYAFDNLIVMLQYCSSYRSSLSEDCLERVGRLLVEPMPVDRLIEAAGCSAGSDDAEILRATVYDLVRRGRARIPELVSTRLHDGLEVEPC